MEQKTFHFIKRVWFVAINSEYTFWHACIVFFFLLFLHYTTYNNYLWHKWGQGQIHPSDNVACSQKPERDDKSVIEMWTAASILKPTLMPHRVNFTTLGDELTIRLVTFSSSFFCAASLKTLTRIIILRKRRNVTTLMKNEWKNTYLNSTKIIHPILL